MSYEFTCKKEELKKENIKKAQVFFRNGDFFELTGSEIISISLQFYDTLIANEQGFSPVVKSGYIKCKLKKSAPKYDNSFLYNDNEYVANRKLYLEERCVNEGGIYYFRLFDKYCWHHGIFGDVIAVKDGDYIIFTFQENKIYGSAEKNYHTLMAPNVTKKAVEKICLDFENCESFDVFKEEIVDMQINFKKELDWNSSCYGRTINNGFIRLRLNKSLTCRYVNVFSNEKIANIKKLEKRLCGDGEDDIDICNLYVSYTHAGYYRPYEERITIYDIRDAKEIESEEDEDGYSAYISGYATKERDGSILIVFGKKRPV